MSGKSLLLEVPNYAVGSRLPATSYVRLGATTGPLSDADAVVTLQQAIGAAANGGAGDDLATRVRPGGADPAFVDDTRQRCDPPGLDGGGQAGAGQGQALRQRVRALEHVLAQVVRDPAGWLDTLAREHEAALRRVEALRGQLQAGREAQQAKQPRDPRFAPRFVTKQRRRQQSQLLHRMGGWRDHTDGNRIVTTRGDKVEVVRGNYRLVVLGRRAVPQDPAGDQVWTGWDVSGGHIDEDTVTVAEEKVIEWKRRHNGTWYTLETVNKGDTRSVTVGDSETQSFGHFQLTMTGSERPTQPWHAPEDCTHLHCRVNPRIHNQTWATEMCTYTGSAKLPVPHVLDKSWVEVMTSSTRADTIVDHTELSGDMLSRSEIEHVMSDQTEAGHFASRLDAGRMLDVKTTAATSEVMIGDSHDRSVGITTSLTLANSLNLTLGVQTDVTLGATAAVNLGMTSDIFLGAQAELSLTGTLSVQVGTVVDNNTAATCELALLDTKTALATLVRGPMVSF